MAVSARIRTDVANSEQAGGSYTVTNHVDDRDMDCNGSATTALADVLGSVISDLIAMGILDGTVST